MTKKHKLSSVFGCEDVRPVGVKDDDYDTSSESLEDSLDIEQLQRQMYNIRGSASQSDRSDTIDHMSEADPDMFLNMKIVVKVHDAGNLLDNELCFLMI